MNAGVEERVSEEIATICGHYLGAPAREEGVRLVYVCPNCKGTTFATNLVTRKAGCWTGHCPPGRYADALGLVSHFDGLSSLPEALGRAREILGLRVVEPQRPGGEPTDADRATTEDGSYEDDRPEHEERGAGETPHGQEEPDGASSGTEGSADARASGGAEVGRLARSRYEDSEGEPEAAEEGWYAVLDAPAEDARSGPEAYRPAGALRPLPSSVATVAELLAALVAFAVGAACAWQLVEHAGLLLPTASAFGAARVLVRHELACALAAGVLASLLAWIVLSSRRHAERRHLGDDQDRPSARLTSPGESTGARAAARGPRHDTRREKG